MKLHVFTKEGLNEFRQNLTLIKSGITNELVIDQLFSSINTKKFEVDIDLPDFSKSTSKYDFIVALTNTLKPIELRKEFYNTFLWSWLSAYYFDLVCPLENEVRYPKAEEMSASPK